MATTSPRRERFTDRGRRAQRTAWRAALAGCAMTLTIGGAHPAYGAEADSNATADASYLRLHPDFVVNLQGSGQSHFLLASIDVMSRDPDTIAAAKHHAAAIRHELVLLLSDQSYDLVKSVDGRQALQRAALSAVNDVLGRERVAGSMEGLFFSSFVVE